MVVGDSHIDQASCSSPLKRVLGRYEGVAQQRDTRPTVYFAIVKRVYTSNFPAVTFSSEKGKKKKKAKKKREATIIQNTYLKRAALVSHNGGSRRSHIRAME